jgi:phenylalanyl-tRNA synthetase beta chain
VFLAGAAGRLPDEPLRLALVWCGAARPRHFSLPGREVAVWDVAGLVERLLAGLMPGAVLSRAPRAPAAFHPAGSLSWTVPGAPAAVAWAGALHPDLEPAIGAPAFLAEIDLTALARLPPRTPRHVPLPRLPAVSRDLSLVVTGSVTWARLAEVLASVPAPAPARFEPVDRYEGAPLEPGSAALTVRVRLEPTERTLTDVLDCSRNW